MNKLLTLGHYFSTGTAEAEEKILSEVFVTTSNIVRIIMPPHASPRLLVGKKGSGKSALLRFVRQRMQAAGIPVLFLRPKDLQETGVPQNASLGELNAHAEAVLYRAVAATIGSKFAGLLTADEGVLQQVAAQEGRIQPDLIQKALEVLSIFGKGLTKIDFGKLAPLHRQSNTEELRQVLSRHETEERLAYVLIDDTDQLAAPQQKGHLNRIWAFLLAARNLTEECPNLRVIITLRTEVWRRLEKDDAGQRDQTDHFRPLVERLHPRERDIRKILERRLELAGQAIKARPGASAFSPFFKGDVIRLPNSEAKRNWTDIVVKRCRQRPRDAIQLVSQLAEHARENGRKKITEADFHEVMPEFSAQRVDDLVTEVDRECPNIREVVRSFASLDFDGGSFTLKADSALKHLMTLASRFSLKLHGTVLQPEDKEHAFRLWRFLYEVGFLNPRVSDKRRSKDFRHISADEDLQLVSVARWNDMQAMLWEVDPVFRDYLIKIKTDKQARFGVPYH